jgi:hypothetical protein
MTPLTRGSCAALTSGDTSSVHDSGASCSSAARPLGGALPGSAMSVRTSDRVALRLYVGTDERDRCVGLAMGGGADGDLVETHIRQPGGETEP